jgi:hypothetical protein
MPHVFYAWARWALLAAACSVIYACGGGGGAGAGGAPGSGGPPPIEITGRASVLGISGVPVEAPAGLTISLRALGTDGLPSAVTATTTTGPNGSFTLRSASLGALPLVEMTQGTQVVRAVVHDSWLELSPASEALYQEVADAVRLRGALPSADTARLTRFMIAATQFLHLIDLPSTMDNAQAIAELRAWLAADPASRDALTALRTHGTLPPTLGDVGGLAGFGRAASINTTSSGEILQVAMRYRADNGGEFDVWTSGPTDALQWLDGQPDMTVQSLQDGLRVTRSLDALLPLQEHLGGVWLARFGVGEGHADTLADVTGKTAGVSYDADLVPDDFRYTATQRTIGYETLIHDAQLVRTLRVQRTDTIEVQLSSGGTLRYEQTTDRWLAPFGGALKSTVAAAATDAAGSVAQATETVTLQRASINGMSWPGRLHVQRDVLTLAQHNVYEQLEPLVAPNAQRIVFGFTPTGTTTSILHLLDVGTSSLIASAAPASGLDGFVAAIRYAQDRQSLYVAVSRPSATPSFEQSEPIEQAHSASAQVLSYSAQDLTLVRRIPLPAHPSASLAGRGYARRLIEGLLVSPLDSNTFAVLASGLMLFGASGPPDIVVGPGAELVTSVGSFAQSTQLSGWDGHTNELHFFYSPPSFIRPPDAGNYRLQAQLGAFSLAAFLPAPALPNDFRWTGRGEELGSPAGIVMVDHDGARLVDRAGGLVAAAAGRRGCSTITGRLICVADGLLTELDTSSLQVRVMAPFNHLLRQYAGEPGARATSIVGVQGNILVAASHSYGEGGISKVDIDRIRLWPAR